MRKGKQLGEVRKIDKEIIIKNGKTEITMNEQEISVSAPKIEIDQKNQKIHINKIVNL